MSWTSTVVTRETLYGEVWAEPVVKVAKRYGVSDVALRKVCVKLTVPMPPLGYWAKRAHGRPTARIALVDLPEAVRGEPPRLVEDLEDVAPARHDPRVQARAPVERVLLAEPGVERERVLYVRPGLRVDVHARGL